MTSRSDVVSWAREQLERLARARRLLREARDYIRENEYNYIQMGDKLVRVDADIVTKIDEELNRE